MARSDRAPIWLPNPTAGGSSLQYDATTDVYTYIWKTDKGWAGTCRQLVIQFANSSRQYANFKFK